MRRVGEDMTAGALVLTRGTTIRPAEIGVLAAVGKARVQVHRRPRVAVLATGDELVDVTEKPGPGQIRNSNNYAVAAQIASWGALHFNLGVARDTVEHTTAKIREALALEPELDDHLLEDAKGQPRVHEGAEHHVPGQAGGGVDPGDAHRRSGSSHTAAPAASPRVSAALPPFTAISRFSPLPT